VDIALLIPLLGLSIPIIAIVSTGATKRAQVQALSTQMIDLDEQQTFTSRMPEKKAGK
jgi:hypothetical protein